MIKFTAGSKQSGDSRLLIGLGLSAENLKRLKEDNPIVVKMEDLFVPLKADILIFYEETEELLEKKLRDMGVINESSVNATEQMARGGNGDHVQALMGDRQKIRDVIVKLLDHLPDTRAFEDEEHDSWSWCWEELDGEAQEKVKTVRKAANEYLDSLSE